MNDKKYNLIFAGTPEFSVPTLEALINDERFYISAAITAPDARVGRKQIVTFPPVKTAAQKHNIPVLQPATLKTESRNAAIRKIQKVNPDVIIVIAYGQIIPKSILDIPKFGCLNLHASLLPKYRGASPIQAAIASGDKFTGVTLMKMDETVDTGLIIAQEKISIAKDETGETLHNKLAKLSAETLIRHLPEYLAGKLKPKPQDDSQATYAPKLARESGKIDWRKPAEKIERMVRAFTPWPGAHTVWNNKTLKIISVSQKIFNPALGDANPRRLPGAVFLHNNQLAVQCGRGALIIKQLQLEGKKIMSGKEFLAGHKEIINQILK